MVKKFLITSILLLITVTISSASDVDGRWTGRFDDKFDITYDFKVSGEVLNGVYTDQDKKTTHIYYGIFKDNELSFTMDMMGDQVTVKGKIKDGIITLVFNMPDQKKISVDLIRTN